MAMKSFLSDCRPATSSAGRPGIEEKASWPFWARYFKTGSFYQCILIYRKNHNSSFCGSVFDLPAHAYIKMGEVTSMYMCIITISHITI
jgi:hypothetical protein